MVNGCKIIINPSIKSQYYHYNGYYREMSANSLLRVILTVWYAFNKKRGILMIDRQGIIVYVNQLKHAKSLRKYGHVHFISRKLKYVVMYCNQTDVEGTLQKLQRLPFVKGVEESFRPFLKTEFENAKPDKAKEYDYKIGL